LVVGDEEIGPPGFYVLPTLNFDLDSGQSRQEGASHSPDGVKNSRISSCQHSEQNAYGAYQQQIKRDYRNG
jgi:hypothetical protein